jgi:hypothetical protein
VRRVVILGGAFRKRRGKLVLQSKQAYIAMIRNQSI